MDDTIGTLKRVYSHLNLPFTKHVENVAFARTHAENITGTNGLGTDNLTNNAMQLYFQKGLLQHIQRKFFCTRLLEKETASEAHSDY